MNEGDNEDISPETARANQKIIEADGVVVLDGELETKQSEKDGEN